MKEVVIAILLIAGAVLTPLGAKWKNGVLVSIGAGCGALAFTLLFMH